MSTHPNALLIAELSPEDLPRKTYMALKVECGGKAEDDDLQVRVPNGVESPDKWRTFDGYHTFLAQDDYDDSAQISAAVGSIVLWDPVTYGYGERVAWADLAAQAVRLEEWCKQICPKLKCSYKIWVSANYW